MCGRYSLSKRSAYVTIGDEGHTYFDFEPRFNVAPSDEMPTVIHGFTPQSLKMRWGRPLKSGGRVINAKVETLKQKFGDALLHRRCLIPNDGFFEWEAKGGKKLPWRFSPRETERIWMFAGLYRVIYNVAEQPQSGVKERQFVIITCEANQVVKPIHARMPLIVNYADWGTWLGFNPKRGGGSYEKCLRPFYGEMLAHRVSPLVNNVKNDLMGCLIPLGESRITQ